MILNERSKFFSKYANFAQISNEFCEKINENFRFRLFFPCLNKIFTKQIEQKFGNPTMISEIRPYKLYKEI